MAQRETWEREYRHPRLISDGEEPIKDLKKFLRFLKKDEKVDTDHLRILDLGSGNGKNAIYLASLGQSVVGLEISSTAVAIARERAQEKHVAIDWRRMSMADPYPFPDASFDVALDIISSNSLSERERTTYLTEVQRVLKPGGWLFVKALCKDGDVNAKALLRDHPGTEHDTYFFKDLGLTERVFTAAEFTAMYEQFFRVLRIIKKTTYVPFHGQKYKRRFMVAYLRKP